MTSSDYARIREVFHAVFVLDEPERTHRLAMLCGDDAALRSAVDDLLRADEDDTSADLITASRSDSWPTISGYRIKGVLGEGGMGTVYRAEQLEPSREVALKVIRGALITDEIVRRFRREAELLARVSHPGIALIHAVGIETEGPRRVPFIAMELIDGPNTVVYSKLNNLSRNARLELIASIGEAVAHAHSRGVIHRDLKPANILVGIDGRPRILDFGIGRATESDVRATTLRTEAGQILGTAAYMSPEQANGDPSQVDERSDIYALGVLLFELLSGELPHKIDDLPVFEALRRIREDEPTRLSSLNTAFRGDIETIVGKALERDADRRYQSASEFTADIRRHLAHEPIAARPPSALYQLGKFTRRNRAFIIGVACVMAALAVGLITTTISLGRESEARREAERSLATADASATFLRQILGGAGPEWAVGRDTELLEDMLERAAAGLADITDLTVRSEMTLLLAGVFADVFAHDRAFAICDKALKDIRSRPSGTIDASIEHELVLMGAGTLLQIGRVEEAEAWYTEALSLIDTPDASPVLLSRCLREFGEYRMKQGRFDEALPLVRRSRDIAVETGSKKLEARACMIIGAIARRTDDLDTARINFERAIDVFQQDATTLHEASNAMNSLAILARKSGDSVEAERQFRAALEIKLRDPRPDPNTATILFNLGRMLQHQERYEEALGFAEHSVEMHEALYEDDHPSRGFAMSGLATVVGALGEAERAEELFKDSIAIWETAWGEEHPALVTAHSELGKLYWREGRNIEAESRFRRAISMADSLELSMGFLLPPTEWLAICAASQGRLSDGVRILDDLLGRMPADARERPSIVKLREEMAAGTWTR